MFKFNPTVQNLVYQKTTRSIRYTHIFFLIFSLRFGALSGNGTPGVELSFNWWMLKLLKAKRKG